MGMDNIWVFAQEAEGAPTSGTLELVAKARALGGTVSAFFGGDGASVAAALGEHGVAKVYSTGDLGGALPGAAVASAMKAVIDGGDAPDLVLFPQNYEGRDVVARLFASIFGSGRRVDLVPTRANGQPAFGAYLRASTGIRHGSGLFVLTLTGDRICAYTRFDNSVLPWFGLPRSLPGR